MTMTSIFLSSLSISGENFIKNKKKKKVEKTKMKLFVLCLSFEDRFASDLCG